MRYAVALTIAGSCLVLGVAGTSARMTGAQQSADTVTFTEHVAPIVFNHCARCHRPGEAAPFSLLTYEDARRRARTIARVTGARYMPPFKAEAVDYEYEDENRLTATQIDVLRQWSENGAPEGDPRKLPKLPKFTEGWTLGKPDLIVTMPEAFDVPASGPDVYRNFVIPLKLNEDKWVRAVDFRASARSVVHHTLFFYDTTGAGKREDEQDPGPGFGGTMGGFSISIGRQTPQSLLAEVSGRGVPTPAPAAGPRGRGVAPQRPGGGVGGWAPGGQAKFSPEDIGMPLPKGSDLIVSTHFHPSGKPEREQSTLGFYFARRPPTRPSMVVMLPPMNGAFKGINIPAGEARYTITDSFVLPVDVKAYSVGAHAHYLGKVLKLTATLPGGKTTTLLSIGDWDLAWQGRYQFKEFVTLPAGTRLDATIVFDNSADNVRNPSSPPRRVTFGEQSTNEMGQVGLAVIAAQPGGLIRLKEAYDQHLREAVLASPQFRRGRGGS